MRKIQGRALGFGLAFMLAGIFSLAAHAGNYPSMPIHLLVGFPPGGGADFVARQTAQALTEELGQTVIVENKPGANGIIATGLAARANPDGYTLLLGVTATHSINPNLYAKLPYDPVRDFTPVTNIGFTPLVLVVNPALPVKSVNDFIKYVKSQPQPVSFASAGNGNITHMAAELFKESTGTTNMLHIPYKGSSPAIMDLLAGRLSMYFDTLPSSLPFIRSGQLRALAVTSAKRADALPDLPTMQEAGVQNYEATAWFGVFGPAGMSPQITQQLNDALRRGFNKTKAQQSMLTQGINVVADTPEQFAQMIKVDIARWRKVTTEANIELKLN